MTYTTETLRRVDAIADLLCKRSNIGKRITRTKLAALVSTPTMRVNAQHVTVLFPEITKRVAEIAEERGETLYVNRPIQKTGYSIAVTRKPYVAVLSHYTREKGILTMLRNDQDDHTLRAMMFSGDRDVERYSTRVLDRGQDYIVSFERSEADIDMMIDSILSEWRDLPVIA